MLANNVSIYLTTFKTSDNMSSNSNMMVRAVQRIMPKTLPTATLKQPIFEVIEMNPFPALWAMWECQQLILVLYYEYGENSYLFL